MRGIGPFIVRRILLGLLVLALVSVVVFAATQALPGDPARAILGRSATPTSLKALRDQLGLDQPVLQQYWDWVTGLLHGDFGTSLAAQIPVSDLLGERLVNSAFLVFTAGIISIPLSILIGAYAALRRDRLFDTTSSIVTLLFAAVPEFVVGVALVVLFATTVFEWLPAVSLIPPQDKPWQHPKELILPTLTLVIAVTPYVARIMRASMIEVLESEYVEMARLKGVPERLVIRRHALPNALGPSFQVIALNLAYLAGGVIVVEFVFNYAGIGGALRDAVFQRDLPVVQTLAMLIATLYVILNLLADIATILVTPRLRTRI
ncbi:MAG TPA: ABC transporter permease [Gaiellales bacterium]|jgi:peptide/nickel transport system permease protein|nr:ABC transporter permease [Gaiellales bacterium]